MDEQIKQIAERLIGLREALELTPEEVAKTCHISVEEYNRIDLIFGDKSSDDVWIKEIDDENCYIVAYGGCDSRCMGGWIFDYRDKYKEEDNG